LVVPRVRLVLDLRPGADRVQVGSPVREFYTRKGSKLPRKPPDGEDKFNWRKFLNAAATVFLRVLGQAALDWWTGKGGHHLW
jgi:hypothetical protein